MTTLYFLLWSKDNWRSRTGSHRSQLLRKLIYDNLWCIFRSKYHNKWLWWKNSFSLLPHNTSLFIWLTNVLFPDPLWPSTINILMAGNNSVICLSRDWLENVNLCPVSVNVERFNGYMFFTLPGDRKFSILCCSFMYFSSWTPSFRILSLTPQSSFL